MLAPRLARLLGERDEEEKRVRRDAHGESADAEENGVQVATIVLRARRRIFLDCHADEIVGQVALEFLRVEHEGDLGSEEEEAHDGEGGDENEVAFLEFSDRLSDDLFHLRSIPVDKRRLKEKKE